jgi:predicted nucleic acid-binding Zn ribbon protein
MSLKACRQCGHPIPDGERSCPHCGEPIAQRSKLIWAGLIAVGCLVTALLVIPMFQPGFMKKKTDAKLTPLARAEQQTAELLASGVVTKAEGHSIWIEPGMWRLRNDEEKKGIASAFGVHAGLADGSNQSWCDVRDNRNGKLIAKWSQDGGLIPVQ